MVTIVVGGARSGKSTFAESMYEHKKDVVYIATSRIEDKEMEDRVQHHREQRPSYWRTYEGTYHLEKAIGEEQYYLLDCITILASNIMFDLSKDMNTIDTHTQQTIEDTIFQVILSLIHTINQQSLELIIVTNEVGCSIVPENHIGRIYRDIIGRINQRITEIADHAYAVICGIPLKLK